MAELHLIEKNKEVVLRTLPKITLGDSFQVLQAMAKIEKLDNDSMADQIAALQGLVKITVEVLNKNPKNSVSEAEIRNGVIGDSVADTFKILNVFIQDYLGSASQKVDNQSKSAAFLKKA